jgi:arabinose-5-phosphate isomerase
MHPSEAQHGDLGCLQSNDILIVISNSGKTREVIEIVELAKKIGSIKVICITSNIDSILSKISDLTLNIGNQEEVGNFSLVPTCSTIAIMALCDMIAVTLMEEKSFTLSDYAIRHASGYINTAIKNKILNNEN